MIRLPFRSILVLFIMIQIPWILAAQEQENSTSDNCPGTRLVLEVPLEFENITVTEEDGICRIDVDGLEKEITPYSPRLPRQVVPVELPVGSDILSVSLIDARTRTGDLSGTIEVNGDPVPGIDPSLFTPLKEIKGAPENHLEYRIGTGLNMDTMETVMKLPLSIYPVIPVEGDLEIMTGGTVRIEYTAPTQAPMDEGPSTDLLIVCPDRFTGQLEEYADYKNLTGISSRVVNLTTITSDLIFDVQGADLQEDIKLFIERARANWSVDHVMLAGDTGVLPAREIMVLDGYDDGGSSDGRFLASDLYFADLYEGGGTEFCSWNDHVSGDHHLLWGEYDGGNDDGADLFPDVNVGRVPADDEAELSLMLEKARMYELTAKGSDWFLNATLCGTNTFTTAHGDSSGVNEGEMISDLLEAGPLSGFRATKHYESLGNLSSIASTVDRGCGFFEMADHGMYSGWGYTSSGTAVTSNLAYNLENGYELPVVVLDACLTHGFDNDNASTSRGMDPVYGYWYYPPGSSYSWRDCLGEYFHKAPNGGAVATFGCTRVGYGGHGNNHDDAFSGYMNMRIHQAYADGHVMTGQMMSSAWDDYATNKGTWGAYNFKTLTEYVLLGDPTVTVGGVEGANLTLASGMPSREILPGETVSVAFNVTNSGFMDTEITFSADLNGGEAHGWSAGISPVASSVDPGLIVNGTIDVTAPENITMGSVNVATVVVTSPIISQPERYDLTFTVGRDWGLEIEMDPDRIDTTRNSRITGHMNISNLGNGEESLDIAMENMPSGWELILGSSEQSMDPYDHGRIPFQIDIPPRTIAGEYELMANVSSLLDPAFATAPLGINIEVENGLALDCEQGRIDIVPGNARSFSVNVSNLGNSHVAVEMGWGNTHLPDWDLSFTRDNGTVNAFSNSGFELTIGVPELESPETYRVFINVTDGMCTASTSVVINVSRVYDYSATCNRSVKDHSLNGVTSFDIDIRNLGNIYDVYRVNAAETGDNWTFSSVRPDLSVDPDEVRRIRISFENIFPLAGNYTFIVTVSPNSGIPVTSMELTIHVREVFDFETDLCMFAESALPGEGMEGVLNITSRSNAPDDLGVVWSCDSGITIEFQREQTSLDPGTKVSLPFVVSSVPEALAGLYEISIGARSMGAESADNNTISIYVKEVYDISVIPISNLTGPLVPGKTHILMFDIKNNGNTRDNVRVTLNAAGAVKNWTRLERDSFTGIEPGSNMTARVLIRVPSWNVTGGDYNISLGLSSLGAVADTGNITLSVESSDDGSGNGSTTNWTLLAAAVGAAVVILIAIVLVAVVTVRRGQADDIEDLGMEWEEDDADEDLWEEDWDDEDDEDWDWDE